MASEPPAERKTFLQLFPQLFLFPLVIVMVAVLVYLLFVASARDNRSAEELLSDLASAGSHARKQDAYTLALKARELAPGEYFSAEVTRRLLTLLEKELSRGDDEKFLEFIVIALGRGGRPELIVPRMSELALEAGNPAPARMAAVRALGVSGADEAAATLRRVVAASAGRDGWEFRWNALAGLVNLRHADVVPLLVEALDEERRELRWSAACWLANSFGNDAGREQLESLADWGFLDRQVGDNGRELRPEQKEKYMIMALTGLARLGGAGVSDILREKSRETRSPQVKNLALELLERADSGAASTASGPLAGRTRAAQLSQSGHVEHPSNPTVWKA